MISDSPTWQPFHPERGRLPSELQLPAPSGGARSGQVVVISAVNHSDEAAWSARSAVRIAREWAASGTRVFLADLNFDAPVLHSVLGEPNEEGVADALLFGASIQRIALPQGQGFFFGPTGTVVADPDDLLDHAGWDDIVEGFLSAGVTLVLYSSRIVAGGPFQHADYRVILTGAGSTPEDVEEEGPGRLLAILAPGSAPENGGTFDARGSVAPSSPEDLAAAVAGREERAAARQQADAEATLEGRSDAAPDSTREQPLDAGASGDEGSETSGSARRKGGSSGTSGSPEKTSAPWLILVLLLVVGGILAAAYLGYIDIPGITPAPFSTSMLLESGFFFG